MQIGILGQGRLGLGLALSLHAQGHTVFSWARNPKAQAWTSKTINDFGIFNHNLLDKLIIASGSSNPRSITPLDEIERTANVLSHISKEFAGQIYYLSSGAVYGDCRTAMKETDTCSPSTIYGLSKFLVEERLREKFGSNLTICRIGNIVPEKLDFGIFKMIKDNFYSRTPIKFIGNSQDSRDYLSERELISILQELVLASDRFDKMNIGSGESISLQDIHEIIGALYPNELKIIWAQRSEFDVSITRLDVTRLRTFIKNPVSSPKPLIVNLLSSLTENGSQ